MIQVILYKKFDGAKNYKKVAFSNYADYKTARADVDKVVNRFELSMIRAAGFAVAEKIDEKENEINFKVSPAIIFYKKLFLRFILMEVD